MVDLYVFGISDIDMIARILLVMLFAVIGSFFISQEVYAHHIVANVEVSAAPMKMSSIDDFVYVAHLAENKISVIDSRTDLLLKEIQTSGGLIAVEAVPDKNKIYAAVFEEDGIDVYDMDTGLYQKTIILPDAELIKTSTGGQLYGQRSNIAFLTGGWDLDYNPNNGLLYVASYNGDVIRVIDTEVDQVMETIAVADDPFTVKVDTTTNKVVVASLSGNAVTIISPADIEGSEHTEHKVTAEIKSGTAPWCLDIDDINHHVFVSHRGSSHISVINLLEESEVAKIPLAGRAQCITVDDSEHRVYVSLFTSNHIVKINGETFEIVDLIETQGPVWDLLIEQSSHKIYATYQGSDEIVVLSPESIRETLPVVAKDTPVVVLGYVLAHGQDVKVWDPYLSIEDTSIMAGISTKDGGSLSVQIPNTLLVSEQNGKKTDFQVSIDGKSTSVEELEADEGFRMISFFVPENSKSLTIKGTDILPEPEQTMDSSMKEKKQIREHSDIICEDKVWIESTKGRIACVTPSTAEKLVDRGWGKVLE